jgi:hypothetical protein
LNLELGTWNLKTWNLKLGMTTMKIELYLRYMTMDLHQNFD